MKKPNLFIVGQPKSGTTALYEFLNQHPEVFMCPMKEPWYFARDLIQERLRYHKREIGKRPKNDWEYLNLFENAGNQKILGEASTCYLYSKVAAEQIYKFNPNAKIIMMLREPVNFLYSYYNYSVTMGRENAGSFEKALALENERKKWRKVPPANSQPSERFYSELIKYYEQVRRFYDVFPPEQIKVIIFEDFKMDNAEHFRDVLEFLRIDNNFRPEFGMVNVRRLARFPKLGYWFFNSKAKKLLLRFLPQSWFTKIKPWGKRILWRKGKQKPVDPVLRRKLMLQYKDEVKKLSEFLNIDLVTKWGYDKIVSFHQHTNSPDSQ